LRKGYGKPAIFSEAYYQKQKGHLLRKRGTFGKKLRRLEVGKEIRGDQKEEKGRHKMVKLKQNEFAAAGGGVPGMAAI